ncbi:MAG: hypothetical protein ACRCYQ_12735 [Nocardioides sp.]
MEKGSPGRVARLLLLGGAVAGIGFAVKRYRDSVDAAGDENWESSYVPPRPTGPSASDPAAARD